MARKRKTEQKQSVRESKPIRATEIGQSVEKHFMEKLISNGSFTIVSSEIPFKKSVAILEIEIRLSNVVNQSLSDDALSVSRMSLKRDQYEEEINASPFLMSVSKMLEE